MCRQWFKVQDFIRTSHCFTTADSLTKLRYAPSRRSQQYFQPTIHVEFMPFIRLNPRARAWTLAFVAVCWFGPVAFAADDRVQRYYDDAQRRYDNGDFDAAIVQLKNVLQIDPSMLAAQALLGRAYLEDAQPEAAQQAFDKAIKLGVHPRELALPMAHALMGQGKFRELLDRFTVDSVRPGEQPDLLVLRGHAYKQLGDLSGAREAFESALAVKPDFVPALRSEAELLIQQGEARQAIKIASDAVQRAPSDSKAWLLKGLTSQASGSIAAAMAEYTKAIELSATNYDARLARAWLLLDQGRSEEVEAEIAYLAREGGKDPRAAYLRATYFQSKGDTKRSQSALTEIAQLLDASDLDGLKRRARPVLTDRRACPLSAGSSRASEGLSGALRTSRAAQPGGPQATCLDSANARRLRWCAPKATSNRKTDAK